MFALAVFLTVYLACSTVTTGSLHNKPYYDLGDAENLFQDFIKQHGKVYYDNKEYSKRLEIFKENLNDINIRNAEYPTAIYAIDRFVDLTHEEWKQHRGLKPLQVTGMDVSVPDSPVPAPKELDWRKKGVVTDVKDQGLCNSNYIFSTIGNIEGQYAMKYNRTLAFSEGQVMDCVEHEDACNGRSFLTKILKDIPNYIKKHGLMKQEDYPYVDVPGKCKVDKNKIAVRVRNTTFMSIKTEDKLMQKLADIGPLSVGLCGGGLAFYHGGIMESVSCWVLDYSMLLVGYGEENGVKFWILKNSWGPKWGEGGYVRLLRGENASQIGSLTYTTVID